MAGYDWPGDDARWERQRKEALEQQARNEARELAENLGFLSAGIYTVDNSFNYGGGPQHISVQEVMLCGVCYSLVPTPYAPIHAEREVKLGERPSESSDPTDSSKAGADG